jgi:hypothetical protein
LSAALVASITLATNACSNRGEDMFSTSLSYNEPSHEAIGLDWLLMDLQLLTPEQRLFQEAAAWKRRWYFYLGLKEEMRRAQRNEQHILLITLKLDRDKAGSETAKMLKGVLDQAHSTALRAVDLSEDELAISFLAPDPLHAWSIVDLFVEQIDDVVLQMGVGLFPEDGGYPDAIMQAARRYRLSRPANVLDLAEYRAKRANVIDFAEYRIKRLMRS